MRLLMYCILFVSLGLAVVVTASPIGKKLEKKSISESAAAGAAEVDQRLDGLQISDDALMESPGAKVDRAKKQASTTFCVEIRHNKPTQVDCDDLHRPHVHVPPPPPHIPEPLPEIHVHPPPPPPPIVIPQQPPPPPPPINIQVPCEPEMAAYVIQPPSEVVYAPTGNCAPQLPTVIHSGGAGAGVQVIHLPSSLHPGTTHQTSGLSAGVSTGGLTIHGQATLPVHAHDATPVHTHTSIPQIQAQLPQIQAQLPQIQAQLPQIQAQLPQIQAQLPQIQAQLPQIQAQLPQIQTQIQAQLPIQTQAPIQVHTHNTVPIQSQTQLPVQGHLFQQLAPGIDCSCLSAQPNILFQRSQGSPVQSNEALALQFLQDIQRNNNNNPQGVRAGGSIVVQPGSTASAQTRQMTPVSSSNPSMSLTLPTVSAGSSVQMNGKSILPSFQARIVTPTLATPPQVSIQQQQQQQPQQLQLQQQPQQGTRSFQIKPFISAGIGRSNPVSFDDSFQSGQPAQGLRLSRGPGEIETKEQSREPAKETPKDEGNKKASPSAIMGQILKKSGGAVEAKPTNDKPMPKNPRIARFLMPEKDFESNKLDDD